LIKALVAIKKPAEQAGFFIACFVIGLGDAIRCGKEVRSAVAEHAALRHAVCISYSLSSTE
jgi:hypothetical protein